MRTPRFWIAALAVALAAGGITLLWPGEAELPAPGPPPGELIPAAPPAPGAAPHETAAPAPDALPMHEVLEPPPPPAGSPGSRASTPPPAEGEAPAANPVGEPDHAFVRDVLANAFADKLPDRRLSAADFDRLADAVLRMRAARKEMAALPMTPQHAAELSRLREELTEAVTEFQEVSGLGPGEFTAQIEDDLQPIRQEPGAADAPPGNEGPAVERFEGPPPE
ncbi:MAG: hypothetical protein ACE5FC_01775 [Myxococcota bacterium]